MLPLNITSSISGTVTDWEAPRLSSNVALGGDSYAERILYNNEQTNYSYHYVWASTTTSANYLQRNVNTERCSYTLYSPFKIKLSHVYFVGTSNQGNFGDEGDVYVSNDDTNYVKIASWAYAAGVSHGNFTVYVNAPNYYNYYKFIPTKAKYTGYWGCDYANKYGTYIDGGIPDYFNAWAANAPSQYFIKY